MPKRSGHGFGTRRPWRRVSFDKARRDGIIIASRSHRYVVLGVPGNPTGRDAVAPGGAVRTEPVECVASGVRLQGYRATVDREAPTGGADVVLDVEVNTTLKALVGSVGCLRLESADHRVENPHLYSPVSVSDARMTINITHPISKNNNLIYRDNRTVFCDQMSKYDYFEERRIPYLGASTIRRGGLSGVPSGDVHLTRGEAFDSLASHDCDLGRHSGLTTVPHPGHSAQIPVLPSSFSYSMRSHAVEISSSHSGQRPNTDVFRTIDEVKGPVAPVPSNRNRIARRISVSCSFQSINIRFYREYFPNIISFEYRTKTMHARTSRTLLLRRPSPDETDSRLGSVVTPPERFV